MHDAAAAIEALEADKAAIQGELDALRVFTDEAQRHIEELQSEVKFYKNLAEEWQEAAERNERLLRMYRAQNIYSAKDSSGHLITNLCSLNRSEIPNN